MRRWGSDPVRWGGFARRWGSFSRRWGSFRRRWGSFVSVGEASRRLMKVPDPLMKVRFALNGLLWRAPTTRRHADLANRCPRADALASLARRTGWNGDVHAPDSALQGLDSPGDHGRRRGHLLPAARHRGQARRRSGRTVGHEDGLGRPGRTVGRGQRGRPPRAVGSPPHRRRRERLRRRLPGPRGQRRRAAPARTRCSRRPGSTSRSAWCAARRSASTSSTRARST
jgi:hypothetical protein